jgi:hypothetical protein
MLHHPALGQQYKALPGLGEFDHFQAHMMGPRLLGGSFANVPFGDKRHFDRLTSDPGTAVNSANGISYTIAIGEDHGQYGAKIPP